MRIYIDEKFLQKFVSLDEDKSFGVRALWNIANNYAQVTWFFNSNISERNFAEWEFSNKFLALITGKGHVKKISLDFETEIVRAKNNIQILFSENYQNWHGDIKKDVLVFTLDNFETNLQTFCEKLNFYYSADDIKGWKGLSALSSVPLKNLTIIDKYVFSLYVEYLDDHLLDNSFISILQNLKIKDYQTIKVYTSLITKSKSVSDFKYQVENIYDLAKQEINSEFTFSVLNSELDTKKFDFHDRNIFTDYCIVKIGAGFKSSFKKFTNTELEGSSIFEKKGYDMIRYRRRMLDEYHKAFRKDQLTIFES